MVAFLIALAAPSFVSDGRLTKPYAVRQLAVSAPELCASLTKQTSIPLTCDSRLANDLVILATKPRPLKETMDRLAAHFGWEWLPKGKGYHLRPTTEFLRKAAQGRGPGILAKAAPYRAAAARRLAEFNQVGERALREELRRLERQMDDAPDGSPKLARIYRRIMAINSLLEMPGRLSAEVVSRLTDAQLIRLADERLVLSTKPGPLQQALPPSVSALIPSVVRDMQAEWERATEGWGIRWRTKDLTFHEYTPLPPIRTDSVYVTVNAPWNPDRHFDRHSVSTTSVFLTANHEVVEIAEFMEALIEEDEASATAPMSEELKRALRTPDEDEKPEDSSEPRRREARWLAKVAELLGVDLISDVYDCSDWYWASEYGFKGQIAGGWMSHRSRWWPRWREEQIPRSLLARLNEPLETLPLNEQAEIVSQLTPAHLHSPDLRITASDYWFYRAWNSTSPEVRGAILRGRSVPLSAMSSEIHTYLARTVQSGNPGLSRRKPGSYEPEFERGLGPQDEGDLEDSPGIRPKPTPDQDYASMYPRYVSPRAAVRLERYVVPGLFDKTTGALYDPYVLMPSDAKDRPDVESIDTVLARGEIHPAKIEALRFHIQLTPSLATDHDVAVATYEPRILKGRSSWPPDLLARIKRHEEDRAKANTGGQLDPPPPTRARPW